MNRPRQLRRAVSGSALLALSACYTYVPITSTPPVGEQMALEVTDKGRVELADRFGPGLLRVEGRLVGDSAEQYILNVFGVSQIDGTSSAWSGERLRIPHEYVGKFEARELSKSRTVVAATAATVAVVAFMATHLAGISGNPSEPSNPTGNGTGINIFLPRLHHLSR